VGHSTASLKWCLRKVVNEYQAGGPETLMQVNSGLLAAAISHYWRICAWGFVLKFPLRIVMCRFDPMGYEMLQAVFRTNNHSSDFSGNCFCRISDVVR
jgi:hypothetical protein